MGAAGFALQQCWMPRAVVDPLHAAHESVQLLKKAGTPGALLVAGAIQAFLDGSENDIARSLGLRPRRGGRYEKPAVQAAMSRRNTLITQFVLLMPGATRADRCKAALEILADRVPAGCSREVLELARQVRQLPSLPTSLRQFDRIVKDHVDTYPNDGTPGDDVIGERCHKMRPIS